MTLLCHDRQEPVPEGGRKALEREDKNIGRNADVAGLKARSTRTRKGRPHAFRQIILTCCPEKPCGCGAINRDAKRRLGVRSASPFGNSRRSSQVAALLVDGLYRKILLCDDTLIARFALKLRTTTPLCAWMLKLSRGSEPPCVGMRKRRDKPACSRGRKSPTRKE